MRGDKWGDFKFLILNLDWPYYAPGLADSGGASKGSDAGRQGRGERERGRSHIPKNVGMTSGGG